MKMILVMTNEEVRQLSQLMISYFGLKPDHRISAPTLPPFYTIVIQRFLYHEHNLSYDLDSNNYKPRPPATPYSSTNTSTELSAALTQLCEHYWKSYRVVHGSDAEPPQYLVDVVDFIERKYFLLFSYETGSFRPD
ncbi:hypothetical protein [Tunicatimonas pelagia]|uniref:hypothetical protein n=1 Tax=Tunicatimonas pelagia TaxID=931531 RepID=UPI002666CAF7|nr:hypothetical protein [Tunicatimonas pelagia]WKN46463.1 hypothetical protein P0M28_30400 [Tunicatimonas pelagia]